MCQAKAMNILSDPVKRKLTSIFLATPRHFTGATQVLSDSIHFHDDRSQRPVILYRHRIRPDTDFNSMGNDCGDCVASLFAKKWFVMLMWQLCSVILCSMNIFNTLLATRNGQTLPFLQLAVSYGILLLCYIWKYERSDVSWLKYVIVSFFNVAGDVVAVFAYNTTSISSAMLLSTTVIFWVAIMAFFFMRQKISLWQLLALIIGFCGIVLVFISDGIAGSRWLGNMLATIAAVCYAIANTLQDHLVHSASVKMYLCRFSIFASPVSLVATGAVEWKQIRDYNWGTVTILFIFGFAILLAVYYSFVPFIMQFSSALEMNISLLSSNFFSLLISILAFHQKATWLYFVGFICIPVAIVIFSLFPHVVKVDMDKQNEAQEPILDAKS
jgi:drug/metabolite transporter (DMT)-like permease